jgi:hypothetical protein
MFSRLPVSPSGKGASLQTWKHRVQQIPVRHWLAIVALTLIILVLFFAILPSKVSMFLVPTSFQASIPCSSSLLLFAPTDTLRQVIARREIWGEESFAWRKCFQPKCLRNSFMMEARPTVQQPFLKKTAWKEAVYNWYIGPIESPVPSMGPAFPQVCQHLQRLGRKGSDEERYICSYRKDIAAIKDKCVVFSIGSNNQFEFEESVHEAFPSSCTIHTFDCTVALPTPPQEVPLQFHKVCLGARKESIDGKAFASLHDMVEMTGGSQPTLLKMDIEGWEWVALVQIMESAEQAWRERQINIYPDQIALEIHINMAPWSLGFMYEEEIMAYFNYLYHKHGYVLAYERPNLACPTCWEILLVRVACHA